MEGTKIKIAVLSGKGGTGKTLVAVNLAAIAKNSVYIDCDVEEPNGHLFFKPEQLKRHDISVKIPVVDEKLCTGCRSCVAFCKFNALAYINHKLMVFDEICHSCGGCSLFCPEKALSEREKVIGVVQNGKSEDVRVISGIMNVGETSGVPIIKEILKYANEYQDITVIDCPPGSACTVMESIKDADYCILVAEPTLFGVHNLNMVHDLVTLFNKPYGVVLNKCVQSENPAETYCTEKNINVLGKILFDNELGTINSNGLIAIRQSDKYFDVFNQLLHKVSEEVQHETVVNP
ncbi:Cobyrinic acid a,c-diamide synthase [Alkaliphilus metalliredigens QYMF]|uniref:Cobyrinic acid a,c-diamide synthase n=1 Tax=Alkaliphilus metalliredigens (strain QYMF) TaxID=293826 RepID=A6TN96_ALKMQ|nr:ATP-binding protein [Alkaliphilus metalliredigens]ABR47664.1 Cobyrinic acid a,c-diamide synthase [Alkaliphilus metalliredigens QYMF]